MSLVELLKVKRSDLVFELEKELEYVDRKDRNIELKLREAIAKIDGFYLCIDYLNCRDRYRVYDGSNSIIENQSGY